MSQEEAKLIKLAQKYFELAEIAAARGKTATDIREIKQLLMQVAFIPAELVTI